MMKLDRASALRAMALLGAGAVVALLVVVIAVALALATSGAFRRAPGSWNVSLGIGGHRLEANVAGLLHLATSPVGLRVLEARRLRTSAGVLAFARDGDTLLVRCAPCRLRHAWLAEEALVVEALELRVQRRADGLLVGGFAIGEVQVEYVARAAIDGVELEWQLARTPLAALYRSAAASIPESEHARIDGALSARGTWRWPQARGSVQLQVDGFAVAGLGTERLQHGRFPFRCTDADGHSRWRTTGDNEHDWIAFDRLGRHLPASVLAAEDQRFMRHEGVDYEEVERTLAHLDLRRDGSTPRGASTLSQQLARTLFTGGERTVLRKLRETLYAVEMERTLGKTRILELYLNTVDWGPGICGARAAARLYFRKSPARLDPLEAAWLAAILRHPQRAWRDEFLTARPDAEAARRILLQRRDLSRRERTQWSEHALTFAPPAPLQQAGGGALVQR
jgi:hypothetical protein